VAVTVAVDVAVDVGGDSGASLEEAALGASLEGAALGGGSLIEVVVSCSMFVVGRVLSTVVEEGGVRSIWGEADAVGFVVLGK
jgi:hypothetical protein